MPQIGQSRILGEMVKNSLALAKETTPAKVDLDALVREGKRIQSGRGMTHGNIEAFKLFYHAASAGHVEAQFLVCECYELGDGVERDLVHFLNWLRKSAESGFAAAQNRLGSCYRNGEGMPQDLGV